MSVISAEVFPALLEKDCPPDPFKLFAVWFAAAEKSGVRYPNAMNLATIGSNGFPDSRIVLLKDFSPDGFVFYTNTRSAKGTALAAVPQAALNFYWDDLMRQVRIRGHVAPVSAADADEYFTTRPRESQIGAHASEQSRKLESRELLIQRFNEIEKKFDGQKIPRPPHWSGYCLVPDRIEFWQERESRLHDRICYQLDPGGKWGFGRLYP